MTDPAAPDLAIVERLNALADKCEAATGPDRELDAAVFNAASEQMERWNRTALQLPLEKRRSRYDDGWVHVYAGKGLDDKYPEDLPRYTASLDAAMSLVPEGWDFIRLKRDRSRPGATRQWDFWCVLMEQHGSGYSKTRAGIPALALCAASLRALAKVRGR